LAIAPQAEFIEHRTLVHDKAINSCPYSSLRRHPSLASTPNRVAGPLFAKIMRGFTRSSNSETELRLTEPALQDQIATYTRLGCSAARSQFFGFSAGRLLR
jgi:hypothetical protein